MDNRAAYPSAETLRLMAVPTMAAWWPCLYATFKRARSTAVADRFGARTSSMGTTTFVPANGKGAVDVVNPMPGKARGRSRKAASTRAYRRSLLTHHVSGEAQHHRRSTHRQSGHSISIGGTREQEEGILRRMRARPGNMLRPQPLSNRRCAVSLGFLHSKDMLFSATPPPRRRIHRRRGTAQRRVDFHLRKADSCKCSYIGVARMAIFLIQPRARIVRTA